MVDDIRRTFALKLGNADRLKELLNHYGEAVRFTLRHIDTIHAAYQEQRPPPTGTCDRCKTADTPLRFRHKKLPESLCNQCFHQAWSMQTLTKAKGFQADLIDAFPSLSPAHKGYYAGVIKFSVQVYKSYAAKKKEREKEIRLLQARLEATQDILQKKKVEVQLIRKQRGLKPIHFRKNVLYLGNAGMFDIEQREDGYYIGFTSPQEKRTKEWFPLLLGKKGEYKTEHNKFTLCEEAIATKEHKAIFGKILQKDDRMEFMYPKRQTVTTPQTDKEIMKELQEHPSTPIACISFGVKRPIQVVVLVQGKIVNITSFGTGALWEYIIHRKNYRTMMGRIFTKRYRSKWERTRKKKAFFRKHAKTEREYLKRAIHGLTKEVVAHLAQWKKCCIVLRDTKGIKSFTYPPMYRDVLSRWNIEMQKTFLEYKASVAGHMLFSVPYKEAHLLTCSKCHKEAKEMKEPVRVLTTKLWHAMEREEYLKGRINSMDRKIALMLQKRITTEKQRTWFKEAGEKLTHYKEQLKETLQRPSYHPFTCMHCGYHQDFYVNDALCLYHRFTTSCSVYHEMEGSSSHADEESGVLHTPLSPLQQGSRGQFLS